MAQRTKPVPLTLEQLQLEKDVKRINERINEIAKAYGTSSYSYNKYYAAVVSSIPKKYRGFSKHGIIQIKRSKEFYRTAGNPATKQVQTRLLGIKTVGKLKKEAKRSLQDELDARINELRESNPDMSERELLMLAKQEVMINPATIEQRMRDIDEVLEFVDSNRDMFYVSNLSIENQKIIHKKGRKKTYSELISIVNDYKNIKNKEYYDIFGGL